MNKYSQNSVYKLAHVHPVLVALFTAILSRDDHSIVCGHRDQKEQDKFFELGRSQVKFPHSKHNKYPSLAVDVAPYIADTASQHVSECAVFGTKVMFMANEMGIPIRWGGDWDGDKNIHEHKLQDFQHFELDVEKYRQTPWFQMYGL